MTTLLDELIETKVVKYGSFTLSSGKTSDLYFDLRQIYSHPALLSKVSKMLWDEIEFRKDSFDLICAVPIGALPFAVLMSAQNGVPLIVLRKEQKTHGTKALIEGAFKPGQRVLIVEDVMTTGESVQNTRKQLESEGLVVWDVIAIINRSGYPQFCLFTEREIRDYVSEKNINTFGVAYTTPQALRNRQLSSKAKKLWDIVLEKKTNICLSADVGSLDKVVDLVKLVGDHICVLKLHWDALDPSQSNMIATLYTLAKEKRFMILDDRKYADIDNIVAKQVYHSKPADFVTAHSIFGQATINGIRNGSGDVGIFLVKETSVVASICDATYSKNTYDLGVENNVDGFIGQSAIGGSGNTSGVSGIVDVPLSPFLMLTPGISFTKGPNYKTPEEAINQGSDILIVGRGIYEADDPLTECLKYKKSGWDTLISCYCKAEN